MSLHNITAKLIEIKGLSEEELESTCTSIATKYYDDITFEDGITIFDYITPDPTGYFLHNKTLYKVVDIDVGEIWPYGELSSEEDGVINFEGIFDEDYTIEDILLSAFTDKE
jgi:hypothetical protein